MRSKFRSFGLVLIGVVAGILISLNLQAIADREAHEPLPVDELRAFTDVFGAIKRNYVEPVPDSGHLRFRETPKVGGDRI